MKEPILLKCGCVASALRTATGGKKHDPPIPCCSVHDCIEPAEKMPDLTGRKARCAYGGSEVDSNYNLAFFEYRPDEEYDRYYCGCYGWD